MSQFAVLRALDGWRISQRELVDEYYEATSTNHHPKIDGSEAMDKDKCSSGFKVIEG